MSTPSKRAARGATGRPPTAALRFGRWLAALALGTALVPALAPTPASARVRPSTPGSYRLRTDVLTDVPLDGAGTTTDQRVVGRHRLRIDPNIELGRLQIRMQIDVLAGQIFGDLNSVGAAYVERRDMDPDRATDGWTTVEPRMLWLRYDTDAWGFEAGQMGAAWGLGLLDSDGHARPDDGWVERLGDRWFGDLVDRARVFVRPLRPLTSGPLADLEFSVGVDHVWQDEWASFLNDDSAVRAFASIFYPGEALQAGLLVMYRDQTWADGDQLELTHLNAYGQWTLPLYMIGADLRLQGELLLQLGHTNRIRPSGRAEGVDLFGLGWAFRGDLAWRCPAVALGLEVGYASGDGNPGDATEHSLTFDPDHKVGLVLFPDVLRLLSLRAADRQADPNLRGESPGGVDLLPTDGGVRNALYLQPGVTWRPGDWRATVLGVLAWSAQPFLDPFETFQAGGSPRNPRGAPAASFYGGEVAASVAYVVHRNGTVSVEVGAQGGLFLAGSALRDRDLMDPIVGKGMLRVDLTW